MAKVRSDRSEPNNTPSLTALSTIAYTIPAVDIELDRVRKLFEVNVFGVMLMVQEFAPLVIAAKGKIVNNTSVLAVFPCVKIEVAMAVLTFTFH